MTLLFLGILILLQLSLIGVCVYAIIRARDTISGYTEGIYDFFAIESTDNNSHFGRILDQTSNQFAEKIGITVQAAIKGSIGGAMKGTVAELEESAIAENPQLAYGKMLPKSIQKNPIAAMGFQMLINKILAGSAGPDKSAIRSGGNGQVKFNL